jgi:hypothetical protein
MAYDFQKFHENLKRYRETITMPGGWNHDLVKTVKRINLYLHSQFETGQTDRFGQRKTFYNITKPACEIAAKFVDIDTKNVVLFSEGSGNESAIWLCDRDLKAWMKKNWFSRELNRFSDLFPKYGHVVSKRSKGNLVGNVKIENLRTDPASPWLKMSSFVYELNPMNRGDLAEMRGKWDSDQIDALLNENKGQQDFLVYECYDRNDEGTWDMTIVADLFKINGRNKSGTEELVNNTNELVPGYELFSSTVEDLDEVYVEEKWDEVPGRWLGLGFAELLFDAQVRANVMAYQKAKGLELSSMQIFQTADENVGRNVLMDLENGSIVKTRSNITQINTQTIGLSEFSSEEQRWDKQVRDLTFSFDIASGEDLPSGTPLGVARISAAMVESYFGKKREKLGIFVKKILMDQVIPAFDKEMSKEHVLRLMASDSEVQKLRQAVKDYSMNRAIREYAARTGTLPSQMAIMMERARLEAVDKRRKDFSIKIPAGFYKDLKKSIDITITGEEIDVNQKQQTLMTALQVLANPAVMQNPGSRAAVLKALQYAGVSPVDLELIGEEAEKPATPQMQPLPTQPQQANQMVANQGV